MKNSECRECSYYRWGTNYCRKYMEDIAKIKVCGKKKIFRVLKTEQEMDKKDNFYSYDDRLAEGYAMLSDEYED